MNIAHSLLVAAFAATVLPAQVTARVIVDQTLTAVAGSDRKSLPRGTDLSSGGAIQARFVRNGCNASASTSVAVTTVSGSTKIEFATSALANVNFFCGARSNGGGVVLTTLRSVPPVAGQLTITVPPAPVGTNFRASGWVDIGNDNSIDLRSPQLLFLRDPLVYEAPVEIGADGLPLLVGAAASATTGSASMRIRIEFRPGSGRVSSSGTPCGPSLRGWLETLGKSTLKLRVSGAQQTPHAFFVLGVRPQAIPIPPTGCLLRTDILAVLRTRVAAGQAQLDLLLPDRLAGTAQLQFLAGTQQGGRDFWRTSQLLRLRLP